MFLGRVIGHVVAPVNHRVFSGHKLLLVRPVDHEEKPVGAAVVAVDRVDAGLGDRVLVIHEGSSARDLVSEPNGPLRAVIVGVVDDVEMESR